MREKIDLLNGSIFRALTKLALPIMATSLIGMAYNMTDMIWIGRVGSDAVAAVGAAGMYMMLSQGLVTLARAGGQVLVAQSLGANDEKRAISITKTSFQMATCFAIVFGICCVIFANPLIHFFRFNNLETIESAKSYLVITGGLVIFSFYNQIYSGILTALGNSHTPFVCTTLGLMTNIVLDPILIFGFAGIKPLGVFGAGLATIIAQTIVTLAFYLMTRRDPFFSLAMKRSKFSKKNAKAMVRIGLPIACQSVMFTFISMYVARLVASWQDSAVAVQKVGGQIESISWLTADGFSVAINAFIAQNYGAKQFSRVKEGYMNALKLIIGWGVFSTCLLVFFPETIFKIFISEPEVVPLGVDYLRILGYSQIFMCVEIVTSGAFSGLGKTLPPSLISVILTASRIPLATYLSSTALGLNGVWWAMTLTSMLKGIILFIWYRYTLKKL